MFDEAGITDDDYTCDYISIDMDCPSVATSSTRAAGGDTYVCLAYDCRDAQAVESDDCFGRLFDFAHAYSKYLCGNWADDGGDGRVTCFFVDHDELCRKLLSTAKSGHGSLASLMQASCSVCEDISLVHGRLTAVVICPWQDDDCVIGKSHVCECHGHKSY